MFILVTMFFMNQFTITLNLCGIVAIAFECYLSYFQIQMLNVNVKNQKLKIKMRSNRNAQQQQKQVRKLIITKKDHDKIAEWYSSYKDNYTFQSGTKQFLDVDQYKQVYIRIYFSQIYFTQSYINSHFGLLRNLSPKPLTILGGIIKSQQQQIQGKPYESKNNQGVYNMDSKSLVLFRECNFFTYCLQTKKRDSVLFIQLTLTNNENQQFRFGKLQFSINDPLKQISQLTVKNKKNEKVGYIQTIIEKDPVKDISYFIPPNIMIDQDTRIPCISSFEMKRKKDVLCLQDKQKVILRNLAIQITKYTGLKEKILKNNPFHSFHHENVQMQISGVKIKMGNNNSWKFVQISKQTNQFNLTQDTTKFQANNLTQNIDTQYLKLKQNKITKIYFQCPKTVFVVILIVQVQYKYNGIINTRSQTLGWCVVTNRLFQNLVRYQCFLQNVNPLPGYLIQVKHEGIVFKVEIQNPQYKKYKKNYLDEVQVNTSFRDILDRQNQQNQLLTKVIFVKRNLPSSNNVTNSRLAHEKEVDQVDKQLNQVIQKVQQQLQRKYIKIKIKGHLSNGHINRISQERNRQIDWEYLLNLENKVVKIGMKLISIIPNTDEATFLKGYYYLPRNLKVKIYFLRKTVQLQASLQDNSATFNIPCFLKSKKQMTFMQAQVQCRKQIGKLIYSKMIVYISDTDINKFYAKGQYEAFKILNQKDSFKIGIQLFNNQSRMGQLAIQISINLKSQLNSYKRQIQTIQKDKILQSLPMKQRMMMRISNYNKTSKQMQNKAIQIYKQKNLISVVNKITDEQINNHGKIQYQLGEPSFFLVEFKNDSSSENNYFTFFIKNCDCAQIVTNEKEYNQVCARNQFKIVPCHKIVFQVGTIQINQGNQGRNGYQNSFYGSKIVQNKTIGILIKVFVQDWTSSIKPLSNFFLEINRNTMVVVTHKFKLIFRPPIINELISLNQVNNDSYINNGLSISLSDNMLKRYSQFTSYTKSLSISNKRGEFKVTIKEKFKSPHKIQVLMQATLIGQAKQHNLLIQINLTDGQSIQVQLGQISQRQFIIDTHKNPQLINQIIILYEKNIDNLLTLEKSVYLVSQQTKIRGIFCSFQQGLHDLVINFFDLDGLLKYKYLLKVVTKMKVTPIILDVQNFIGQRIVLNFPNPYVDQCQFFAFSNSNSLHIQPQTLTIQPKCRQRIIIQVTNKLYTNTFIAIYDNSYKVVQMYQITLLNKNQNTYILRN